MASAVAASITPALEDTYYPGATIQLYSFPPPLPPDSKRCPYEEGSPRLTKIGDRYNKSTQERITDISPPPDVLITLERRFDSSTHNIPHVWLAQVHFSSQIACPHQLVAKIYDPVWFDDAQWCDPFKLCNRSVSQEVESYQRLEQLQGTKVPRFYGHFVAPLASQLNRTVNVILMEYIPGQDLLHVVPQDVAGAVCHAHKDAILEAVLNIVLDMDVLGVGHLDLQSRNVILRPPKERREFCASPTCPLRLEADYGDLEIVMIDFEMVEFREPRWAKKDRRSQIDRSKLRMFNDWLEGRMA